MTNRGAWPSLRPFRAADCSSPAHRAVRPTTANEGDIAELLNSQRQDSITQERDLPTPRPTSAGPSFPIHSDVPDAGQDRRGGTITVSGFQIFQDDAGADEADNEEDQDTGSLRLELNEECLSGKVRGPISSPAFGDVSCI
jgi:hypothetical protein